MANSFFSSFRTNLLSGAIALAPLAAVIWVIAWLWRILRSVRDILPQSWEPHVVFHLQNPWAIALTNGLTTFVLLSILVFLVASFGMISRHILGQRILETLERFVDRIPVLRTVYSTLNQLLETFGRSGQGRNFRRVVLIEYPRAGLYTLALVTGERASLPGTSKDQGPYLNIFVPTTPNPTSGFYLTVAARDAQDVPISVEEALKQIISMGIVQ